VWLAANAELYCKMCLPFVMCTTGGDRQHLHKTVQDANIYAVISPQMGKQVILVPSCCQHIWIILNMNLFLYFLGRRFSCCHGNHGRIISWCLFRLQSRGIAWSLPWKAISNCLFCSLLQYLKIKNLVVMFITTISGHSDCTNIPRTICRVISYCTNIHRTICKVIVLRSVRL
jgi:hypothetical protein